MADTTFTDEQTVIVADWLNEINGWRRMPPISIAVDTTLTTTHLQSLVRCTADLDVTIDANVFQAGDVITIGGQGGVDIDLIAGAGMTLNGTATVPDGEARVIYFVSATEADIY